MDPATFNPRYIEPTGSEGGCGSRDGPMGNVARITGSACLLSFAEYFAHHRVLDKCGLRHVVSPFPKVRD